MLILVEIVDLDEVLTYSGPGLPLLVVTRLNGLSIAEAEKAVEALDPISIGRDESIEKTDLFKFCTFKEPDQIFRCLGKQPPHELSTCLNTGWTKLVITEDKVTCI